MSDAIIVALITALGSILNGLITAHANNYQYSQEKRQKEALKKHERKQRTQSKVIKKQNDEMNSLKKEISELKHKKRGD